MMSILRKVSGIYSRYVKGYFRGIDVTVSPVPFSVRIDRGSRGDFETILGGWAADYADPSSFLDLLLLVITIIAGVFQVKPTMS